jgi:ABC transporter ATP binding protein
MTRFTIDIQRIQTGIISTLRMLIIGPTNLIVGLILGLLTNLKLSISFAVMVPLIIITISIAAILLNKKFKLEQKNNEEINVQSQENVLGIKVIKSYNLESLQENKFENANLNQINTSKKI